MQYHIFALNDSTSRWNTLLGTARVTHSSKDATSLSSTSRSIPARRHIRTLSPPGGTVGGTTGRTMNPFDSRKVDRACGSGVISPTMGEGVAVDGKRRMCEGVRERRGVRRVWR